MSGPTLPNLNSQDCQLWEQLWSLIAIRSCKKPKIVSEFKNALQLTGSALPEKVIDNSVKDCKRLQACVTGNGGHFEHYDVIIHVTDTNCYI